MGKPVIFKTPGGEKMVVLALAEYEALVAGTDPSDDAADVEAYDEAMAKLEGGEERPLTPDEMTSFYARPGFLRGLRRAAGETQAGLAARAGIAQSFLSEIEAGRRNASPGTMRKIAAALSGPASPEPARGPLKAKRRRAR